MIMVHSDDQGLVCPPKAARIQVVIVPIYKTGDDVKGIMASADNVLASLKNAGIRAYLDDRDKKNPGEKFNEWELKGVPIRLELGPKDCQNNEVRCVKRNDGTKAQLKQEGLGDNLNELLVTIQKEMYNKALEAR
jgi:prolyl-tRNA synthetase